MLVISRRKGQRITIGDEIELVVTELHRSTVKIGIRAPRGYVVLRGEVHDSIEEANRAAAGALMEFELECEPSEETTAPRGNLLGALLKANRSRHSNDSATSVIQPNETEVIIQLDVINDEELNNDSSENDSLPDAAISPDSPKLPIIQTRRRIITGKQVAGGEG